ncbi:iron chelate uptake ABC transporter family permease subunit [Enterococcus sp. HY326]|uniref:iron chelate uptake ABC transporter family permease subunit n=1 Tax=Enterococcus sp. HY326 TaxID=2971265 RepID=UPI00223F18EC|nr:iron chelate uptake ABC transporter family permease subunit [Enterococcus sp. HY326]
MKKMMLKISFLTAAALVMCLLYLTYNTHGNFEFALQIRGKKIAAFILVAIATSFATISFQTMTQNHFLTPNILGLDSLYVAVQTLLFFAVGGVSMLSQEGTGLFLANIAITMLASLFLSNILLKHSQNNLFLLLMIGMILGTLFSSLSTFLQVLMDPNEYDLLQGRLFASFNNVNSYHLLWAAVLIGVTALLLLKASHYLDVLHLGREQGINLGINVTQVQLLLLLAISLLTGTATALVGPVTFLGFIVSNISYQLLATYRHRWLFAAASLLGIIFLIGGQFLVEQIFQLNTTLSVVIEFVGGTYFIGKLIWVNRLTRKRIN